MGKIITYSFCEPFIDNLVDFIDQDYIKKGKDISKLAICFGGKRPALFVKRAIAQKMDKSFLPPRFFTIDEFISYTVQKSEVFKKANDLDQCYLLYNLAKKHTPDILKGRESFAQFLAWTREILAFIDQLDLEDVEGEKLKGIKENAKIGYAVPEDINVLLESVVSLRGAYHKYMLEKSIYSRGFQYLRAKEVIKDHSFDEFDTILFCNFFYLNRTEEAVIKNLYDKDKAILLLQGDERKWPALTRISKSFDCSVFEGEKPKTPKFDLKLYAGFDVHSQVGVVREILKGIKDLNNTVIVLPNPDNIISLLSEIAPLSDDFNISMGYPLKRSSLYSLLEFIFQAQMSKSQNGYYARDYLKVIRHPLVKNLKITSNESVTRVLVHKIEEMLTGQESSDVSGSIFINPEDVIGSKDIYPLTKETLNRMGIEASYDELKRILKQIHDLVFVRWEVILNFGGFSSVLDSFMKEFVEKSYLKKYALNIKIASKIMDIIDEISQVSFNQEKFSYEDIFKIFDSKIQREIVSFVGSPLKGLQILGLFETRSLNFENVIVLDTNEGVLPRLNIYEPLIPREVMISLNLDRLEQEEEIQRYQFMRLISSAKNVHLVYQESKDKERSRFVEELVWEEDKKERKIGTVSVVRPSFQVKVEDQRKVIYKTPEMIEALGKHTFSASSINMYLRDPIEFYYNYVLGLREKEDLLDEPENRQVGIFVHELLEDTFKQFVGEKPVIDAKFKKYFKETMDGRFESSFGRSMKSDAFLLKTVLDARLNRFLDNEAEALNRRVSQVLFVEKSFVDKIPLSCGEINFVYKLDRVDKMETGEILIVDYKTGSIDPMPKAIGQIESMDLSRQTILENVKSFQIPLYFFYLDKYFKNENINAAFYNLRTLEMHKFIDKKMGYDRGRIKDAFLRALDFVMNEILDPKVPFQSE